MKPMTCYKTWLPHSKVLGTATCNSQVAEAGLVWPYDPAQHFVEDCALRHLEGWLMPWCPEEELVEKGLVGEKIGILCQASN